MNETIASPGEWMQLYQQSLLGQSTQAADATVVTTGSITAASAGKTSSLLNPDGRVSKPARKRSRASRRTPTTLFNTDTTNFRAMVQKFTGGPSAGFTPSGFNNMTAQNFNFGMQAGARNQAAVNPSRFQLQYQQQQNQPFMLSMNNSSASGNVLLPRGANMGVPEGFFMDGDLVSSHGPGATRPSSASNGNRRTNLMF